MTMTTARAKQHSLLFALVCLCLSPIHAFRGFRYVDIINKKKKKQRSFVTGTKDAKKNRDASQAQVEVDFIEQPIDHFDTSGVQQHPNVTLMQRFFYSHRHVHPEEPNRPPYAFLCVGGEGPSLDESVLIDSAHCTGDMLELAKRLDLSANVYLFALEHRYYGESYPVFINSTDGSSISPVTNENIRFLSSRQALEDLKNFVHLQNQILPRDTKWVTFGGSYPGFLSAHARVQFPHLIHASVSSSAPIHLMVDFPGYKERQAWDLQYDAIGGSSTCLKIVMDGHDELANALKDDGDAASLKRRREDIADMFCLCDANQLNTTANIHLWLGDGVVDIPAQGNDPDCTDDVCNLERTCEVLLESFHGGYSAMESLAILADHQRDEGECIDIDWQNVLDSFADTSVDDDGERSWFYQTCTEVGYYQTCEEFSLCPFGRGYHVLDSDYELCQVSYGLNATQVNQHVEATSNHYRGKLEASSRILSVNGNVDPWSVLALLYSDDMHRLPTHNVPGASHHSWTHAVRPETDSQELRDARDIIHLQIMEWLEEEKDGANSRETQTNEEVSNDSPRETNFLLRDW